MGSAWSMVSIAKQGSAKRVSRVGWGRAWGGVGGSPAEREGGSDAGCLLRSHTDEQTSRHPGAGLLQAGKGLRLQGPKSGRWGTYGFFPDSVVRLLIEAGPACLWKPQVPYHNT